MLAKNSFFRRHKKFILFLIVVAVLVVGGVGYFSNGRRKMKTSFAAKPLLAAVTSGDITTSITGAGTISSASTKTISSEVAADVLSVNVAVGDKVSKGDVLFVLDDTDLDTKIRSFEKSISNQNKTISEYKEDISNLNIYATESGFVSNFSYAIGDSVSKNATLFNLTNNDEYVLKTTFIYNENTKIEVGDIASIRLVDTFASYTGEVTYVSDFITLSEIDTPLQEVEILVKNPGYTIEGIEAVVTISNDRFSVKAYETAVFESKDSIKFKSESSGTVKTLNIRNGDYVEAGELIMVLENDDLLEDYSDAKESLSDLYEDLEDVKNDIDFYTITAPIDGVVTSLSIIEGDYVRAESILAKIVNNYDVEFEIEVDELDILDIKIGQEVKVTIDAIEETLKTPLIGTVSEIALEGTSMNSVTTYPVTISFVGNDFIKMGMNCSAEIIIESREDVLTLPVEAVTARKDKYYVTLEDGTEKEIEIGIFDEDNIEVVSGLIANERVLLPELVAGNVSSTEENNRAASFGGFGGMGGVMPGGMTGSMPMDRGQMGGSMPRM